MSKDWTLLLVASALIVGCFFGCIISSEGQYRKGQIDALNGKWKYKMEIKKDTIYKPIYY